MSEAALRAAVPPHFSKDSPCWAIYSELKGIHNKLEQIAHAKTHSVCVTCACDARCAHTSACDGAQRPCWHRKSVC